MKIEKLTAEQEVQLKEFYNEYLEIGRSIKPIIHPKCEEIITKFYARINKPAPTYMYFSSPMQCALAINIMKKIDFTKIKIPDGI